MIESEIAPTVLLLNSITAIISITITSIALIGFIRFKSWKLLFLGISFLILSIPFDINLLEYIGITSGYNLWTISILRYISFIFSLFAWVAFGLMAYVYLDDKKNDSIPSPRKRKVLCSALMIIMIVVSIFFFSQDQLIQPGYQLTINVMMLLATMISFSLIIFISTSLLFYYVVKRKKQTIIVMLGFILLFIADFLWYFYDILADGWYIGSSLVMLLAYATFLIAIFSPRFLK